MVASYLEPISQQLMAYANDPTLSVARFVNYCQRFATIMWRP